MMVRPITAIARNIGIDRPIELQHQRAGVVCLLRPNENVEIAHRALDERSVDRARERASLEQHDVHPSPVQDVQGALEPGLELAHPKLSIERDHRDIALEPRRKGYAIRFPEAGTQRNDRVLLGCDAEESVPIAEIIEIARCNGHRTRSREAEDQVVFWRTAASCRGATADVSERHPPSRLNRCAVSRSRAVRLLLGLVER